LWISILSKGWKLSVIHEPLFLYRRRQASLSDRDGSCKKELIGIMKEIHGGVFARYHND